MLPQELSVKPIAEEGFQQLQTEIGFWNCFFSFDETSLSVALRTINLKKGFRHRRHVLIMNCFMVTLKFWDLSNALLFLTYTYIFAIKSIWWLFCIYVLLKAIRPATSESKWRSWLVLEFQEHARGITFYIVSVKLRKHLVRGAFMVDGSTCK